MKKARHKKEKQVEVQVEAQVSSGEQHHESGSGDDAQPVVAEEPPVVVVAVDSREGEKCFAPVKSWRFPLRVFSIPDSLLTGLKLRNLLH